MKIMSINSKQNKVSSTFFLSYLSTCYVIQLRNPTIRSDYCILTPLLSSPLLWNSINERSLSSRSRYQPRFCILRPKKPRNSRLSIIRSKDLRSLRGIWRVQTRFDFAVPLAFFQFWLNKIPYILICFIQKKLKIEYRRYCMSQLGLKYQNDANSSESLRLMDRKSSSLNSSKCISNFYPECPTTSSLNINVTLLPPPVSNLHSRLVCHDAESS